MSSLAIALALTAGVALVALAVCSSSSSPAKAASTRPAMAPDNARKVATEVGPVWITGDAVYVNKCDTIRKWIDSHTLRDLVGIAPPLLPAAYDFAAVCGTGAH